MTETGFNSAAIDSAHAFRAIMQAMSRPGLPSAYTTALAPPAPFHATTAAVALTLCDFQTPVWISPALSNDVVLRYLRFHTGAPVTSRIEEAKFAFIAVEEDLPALDLLAQGTHEYPDRSATLVVQAQRFNTRDVELSGPGIRGRLGFGVEGVPSSFWNAMAQNHGRFPIGVDVIFTTPEALAAVPRSSELSLMETA